MRWGYLNIFLIFVLVLLWFQIDNTSVFSSAKGAKVTASPAAKPTPTQAPPARLIVPRLSLDSLVEPVGVDDYGKMEVPTSTVTVGWYTKAAKPGEKGAAIIDGHFDSANGQPAIFYNLNELNIGDKLFVIDQLGNKLEFVVSRIEKYPVDTVIEDIYKKNEDRNLILITCAGWWNTSIHSYSHRLVVYAKM